MTSSFRKGYISAGHADEDPVSGYLVAISSDIHGWVCGLPSTACGASTLRRYKTSVVNALNLPGVSLPGGESVTKDLEKRIKQAFKDKAFMEGVQAEHACAGAPPDSATAQGPGDAECSRCAEYKGMMTRLLAEDRDGAVKMALESLELPSSSPGCQRCAVFATAVRTLMFSCTPEERGNAVCTLL